MRGHIIGKLVNALQGMDWTHMRNSSCLCFNVVHHALYFRYLRSNWVSRLPGDIGMDANGAYIPRKPLGWSEAYAEGEPSWAGTGPTGVEIPSTQAPGDEPLRPKSSETGWQPNIVVTSSSQKFYSIPIAIEENSWDVHNNLARYPSLLLMMFAFLRLEYL